MEKADSISTPLQSGVSIINENPIDTLGNLGKYAFLFDYQIDILTPQASQIMMESPIGGSFTLPAGSFRTLKYSKGDVVDVVGFKRFKNDKGITLTDQNSMIINVPKYIRPIGGSQGFFPTITIDNSSLGWLEKVPDTIPATEKLGVNFGENINPKTLPVLDSPIVKNGIEDTTSTGVIFNGKNNLLIIAGVLFLGCLLLNDKSE